jgi:hypothetical protein
VLAVDNGGGDAGRGDVGSVASSCAPRGEDEDDALRLVHIHVKRYVGLILMVGWAVSLGLSWAAEVGCGGQVRSR